MRVLTILGLEDLFSQVIDILDIRPYCKPMPEAYRIALEILGNPDPRHCVLIDDRLVNIEAAIGMGMGGVWLSYGTNQSNHTRAVKTLSDLASVIPV
jgi:putative hydrolase of the HAD superfamily